MRAYSLDIGQDEDLSEAVIADNDLTKGTVGAEPKVNSIQGQVVALSLPAMSHESSVRQSVAAVDEKADDDSLRAPEALPARDLLGFWNEVQTAGGDTPTDVVVDLVQNGPLPTAASQNAPVPDAYLLMGDYFVLHGKINEEQRDAAILEQTRTFERTGEILMRLGYVSSDDVQSALAWQQGKRSLEQLLRMFKLKANHIRSVLLRVEKRNEPMQQVMRDTRYLSEEKVALTLAAMSTEYQHFANSRIDQCRFADLIEQGIELSKYDGYVPVAILDDGTLAVALEDAERRNDAHNEFGKWAKKKYLLASSHTLQKIYCTYFSRTEEQLIKKIAEAEALVGKSDETDGAGGYMRSLIGLILRHASYSGASDIHIECSRVIGTLSMRYDGVRRDVAYYAPALHERLANMLSMDGLRGSNEGEAASSVMREGKISFEKDKVVQSEFKDIFDRYGYRLEIGTAANQSKTAVIRVIDSQGATADVDNLGLDDYTRNTLDEAINAPDGLILLVGPTGSGKTTTLYAAMDEIDAEEFSIQTIENPVEGEHGKWKQYQPRDAAGAAEGSQMGGVFKGTMRNDPDVILVGEIRDGDVADTAIQAAKTGHLVFSTLHVDRAAGTPTRLIGMGVDRQDVADTVRLIMAQRLVRQLCNSCAEVDGREETLHIVGSAMTRFLKDEMTTPTPMRARDGGCEHCRHTGYRGRRMVFETVKFTKKIRLLIEQGATTSAIEAQAIPNGRSMWDYGLRMLAHGRTSLDEIKRVIPDWSEDA